MNFETIRVSGVPRLAGLSGLPQSLWACGDLSLLSSGRSVAVAGARAIGSIASAFASDFISRVSKNLVVVSGLALGADTVAHHACLSAGGRTIAVLPSGFNNIAPASNRGLAREIVESGGLLLSAYHPDSSPTRSTYVERNRIIAGLGDYLFVPQCSKRSGTMHTVRFASGYGRRVLVFAPASGMDGDYSGNRHILQNFSNSSRTGGDF